MDIFLEKIVARRKGMQDRLFNIGIVAVCIIGSFFAINYVGGFGPIVAAVMIYGAFYLTKSRNVEFEYAVTNGDLDIDRIVAQRSRKRIFSSHCKEFEIVAKVRSDHYNRDVQNIAKKIEAISSMDSPDIYFATLNYKGERTVIFFEPDKRMLDNFRIFIPRKIFE